MWLHPRRVLMAWLDMIPVSSSLSDVQLICIPMPRKPSSWMSGAVGKLDTARRLGTSLIADLTLEAT